MHYFGIALVALYLLMTIAGLTLWVYDVIAKRRWQYWTPYYWPAFPWPRLSLTYEELFDLAIAEDVRTESVGQYFNWKHSVLLELLKAALAFLAGNVALCVGFIVKPDPNAIAVLQRLTNLDVGQCLVSGLIAAIIVPIFLLMALRRIPAEYATAIRFISLVR